MKIENLNLSALKFFLDAVELQSITLSADRNHVSRPAVSQAILRLEEWYGKKLLKHEKRLFALTDEGLSFYRKAKVNFDHLQAGLVEGHRPSDSLKIGCSASLIDLVFPKIQQQISKSHQPLIKIGSTPQLLQMLEQKKIHLAFLISTQEKSNLSSFEFQSGQFELRSKSGQLTEILIVTETRPEVEAFSRFFVKAKINFEKQIEVESWTVASRLAEMTNGTCLVPDYLPKGKLRSVATKIRKWTYSAQLLYHRESVLSELEIELIRKIMQ